MEKAEAAVYEGPRRISIQDFPLPKIGSDEMLIEMEMSGVCGTDIKIYKGDIPEINKLAPVILGDEILGHVLKCGEKAAKKHKVKRGDRVIVEARWPCHCCHYCLTGCYYLCEKGWVGTGYGWISCRERPHLWGSYATHVYVPPDALVYKVPDYLPSEVGILAASVLANAVYWTDRVNIKVGDAVAIIGPGPLGIANALVGKLKGAGTVIVVGLNKDRRRLEMAKKFGADYTINAEKENLLERIRQITNGTMADTVIECAGTPRAMQEALDIVKPRGSINHVSITSWQSIPLIVQKIVMKELTILGSLGHPYTVKPAIELATKLFDEKRYTLEKLITHKFPLERAEEALKVAGYEVHGEEPIKTVIDLRIDKC